MGAWGKRRGGALDIQVQGLSEAIDGLKRIDAELPKELKKGLREDARPGAEEAVRIKALVRRVAQAEDLHAHEEDVAQALSEICRANHMTMEELQPYYDDAFAAAVEYSILLAKVTKRIRESAVLEQ